jgi:stage II sporulation protein D
VTEGGRSEIRTLALDEYVAGAVRAEVPPRWLHADAGGRMLRVQALVSRTYAVAHLGKHRAEGFDLCDTTHCQLYRPITRSDDPARRAAFDTSGQIITFGNRPIDALFHSNCGGHTAAADSVWGGRSEPYLQPVDDGFCRRLNTGGWIFSVDRPRLIRALDSDPRTRVGGRLDDLQVPVRDASGRATQIGLTDGKGTRLVRSEVFRTVLSTTFGAHSLRSTQFTVERRGDRFVFEGVGYGHGVGLCQTGAAARAQEGHGPEDIIGHYFAGTRITVLN